MAVFSYRALDAQGIDHNGSLEADSARHARGLLKERGLFPTEVKPLAGDARQQRRVRLSVSELCLMTRQLSALLGSGLNVPQALAALGEQAENPNTRAVLAAVRSEVVGGQSLRAAMESAGNAFPPIYRASVAAGEKSGQLAEVMAQLADYLERQDAMRRKTLQALLYPAVVATVALLVVVALLTYVVPQVVSVFQQGKQALPLLTRILIFASALLKSWGWLMLLGSVAGAVGFHYALREPHLQRRWDAWLLSLPLVGRYLRTVDTARFASTLAILVSSGVPLLSALDAGRQVIQRMPLRDAVSNAADRVREGASLSQALKQTQAFPPLLIHMISSGEATGELSGMLFRAAQLQQTEVENRTAMMTTLLEPLLLLFMGGTVLLIVLAVMQPIIQINTLLK